MYKYVVKRKSFWDGKSLGDWQAVRHFDRKQQAFDYISKEQSFIGSNHIRRDYKVEFTYM